MNKKRKNDWGYVGERLLKLREELGFSRIELAFHVGCSEPTIRYLESGKMGGSGFDVIIFFQENHDINPAWVLLKDNVRQPKYLATESKISLSEKRIIQVLTEELNTLKKERNEVVVSLKKLLEELRKNILTDILPEGNFLLVEGKKEPY